MGALILRMERRKLKRKYCCAFRLHRSLGSGSPVISLLHSNDRARPSWAFTMPDVRAYRNYIIFKILLHLTR